MTTRRARHRGTTGPGFVLKHLMGEYSLLRSYWVHTVLLAGLLTVCGWMLLGRIGERYGLRYLSMGVIGFEMAVLIVWLWALAGTWMAAFRHLMGRGPKLWALLAIVSLALVTASIMREAAHMRPFIEEHWATAMGRQPAEDFHIELVNNGRVVAAPDETGKLPEGAELQVDTRYLVLGEYPSGTLPVDQALRESWETLSDQAESMGIETVALEEFVKLMGWRLDNRSVAMGAGARAADFPPQPRTQEMPRKTGQPAGTFRKRLPGVSY